MSYSSQVVPQQICTWICPVCHRTVSSPNPSCYVPDTWCRCLISNSIMTQMTYIGVSGTSLWRTVKSKKSSHSTGITALVCITLLAIAVGLYYSMLRGLVRNP